MRLNELARWVVGLAAGVAVLGCSDSSPRSSGTTSVGSLSCGSTPCGGDVMGTWDVQGACLEGMPDFSSDECPSATGSVTDFSLSGSFAFHDDGTGTNEIHVEMAVRARFPQSCLMGVSCQQLEEAINRDDDGAAVQCTGSGSCNCTVRFIEDTSEAFTWETSGSQLILDGDTSAPLDYCVDGSALMIRSTDGEGNFTFTSVLEQR